jgi:hypothetical protein
MAHKPAVKSESPNKKRKEREFQIKTTTFHQKERSE